MADNDTRMTKKEFLAAVSKRAGVTGKVTQDVYAAMVDELLDTVSGGRDLLLTGFGRFYARTHAGHSVQFAAGANGELAVIDDYRVLKFSASREVNRSLDKKT